MCERTVFKAAEWINTSLLDISKIFKHVCYLRIGYWTRKGVKWDVFLLHNVGPLFVCVTLNLVPYFFFVIHFNEEIQYWKWKNKCCVKRGKCFLPFFCSLLGLRNTVLYVEKEMFIYYMSEWAHQIYVYMYVYITHCMICNILFFQGNTCF